MLERVPPAERVAGGLTALAGWRRLALLFACLGAAAMLSQFLRSATGVIAPDMMAELSLSPDAFGVLTAGFFLAFAAAQVPIGLSLDRYGSRVTIAVTILFAAAGAALMASAQGFVGLLASRVMMGVGAAAVMMGAFSVLSRWVPASRFSTAVGIMASLSYLGSLLATAPMAFAAETFGWRATFFGIGAAALGIAAIIVLGVREAPPGRHFRGGAKAGEAGLLRGLAQVFAHKGLPPLLAMSFVTYASTITLLGLWAAPYLHAVFGLEPVARGNVLLAMTLALTAGTLVYGPFERWVGRRRAIVIGGSGSVASLAALVLAADASVAISAILLSTFCFCNSLNVLLMSEGRRLYPAHLVGRALTTVNIAIQLGAAVFQTASGFVVGAASRAAPDAPALPFRVLVALLAAAMAAALVSYVLAARDGAENTV